MPQRIELKALTMSGGSLSQRFCREQRRMSHSEKSSHYVQDRNIPMR
jgi:hypothetical protein